MSQEVELKFILAPERVADVSAFLGSLGAATPQSLCLINRYFDTPDLKLQQKKVALRIRQKNDKFLQTFKTKGESSGGLHRRLEWEWPIDNFELDQSLLESTGQFPEGLGVASLSPVFETNFDRQAFDITVDGIAFEVALDVGEIIAADKRKPLCELELELRQEATPDAVRALFALAEKIALKVPLFPSDISKGERGYHLAGGYKLADLEAAKPKTLPAAFRCWVNAHDYFQMTGEERYSRLAATFKSALLAQIEADTTIPEPDKRSVAEDLTHFAEDRSVADKEGLAAIKLMRFL
jgi:inorganic triphosphatase YgiF